jgi:tRNA pseudouridine38-40 synthase
MQIHSVKDALLYLGGRAVSDLKNIKLTIQYDGTQYSGWQIQKNATTISGILQAQLSRITKEDVKLIGASRTDAGVHALGQTAHFLTRCKIPPQKFSYVLNSVLPKDIVVGHSCEVPLSFHSRFDTVGKTYRYLISNSLFPSPLDRNRAYHVPQKLLFHEMQEACTLFSGTHDFSAFRAAKCGAISTIKTIQRIGLTKNHETLAMDVTGDGFLYNMVRIMVGTLIDVGLGKMASDEIRRILLAKDRRRAGRTSPGHGLYLMEVFY